MIARYIASLGFMVLGCSAAWAADPPSLLPPSELATSTGRLLSKTNFLSAEDCGACHARHYEEWNGSLHSQAHRDPLYRAFAELARKEGGDELYVFCSSCHAAGAVVTGEIPGKPGPKPSFLVEEGVTCDVCHKASEVRKQHLGFGGKNASLVLDGSDRRFGPIEKPDENDAHPSAFSTLHTNALLCSACHTLVHPRNGLVIENTFEEWRASAYAAAGIACQECHMRPVANAVQTALTLRTTPTPGTAVDDGPKRPDTHEHRFVGANTLGRQSGAGDAHTAAAQERLKSAATVLLDAPPTVAAGKTFQLGVTISNTAAGHAIPTSITELRQVWLDVSVTDATGAEVFRRGQVDATGRVDTQATIYHSVLGDKTGQVTYLPWRAEKILAEHLIPPRAAVHESIACSIPAGAKFPLQVRATLCYRSAPQDVLDQLFGKGSFTIPVVEMATAQTTIAAGP